MANTNLSVKKGRCINFGNCKKADAREVQEVSLGDEFICQNPDCAQGLIEIQPPPTLPWKWMIVVAIVLLGGGAAGYFLLGNGDPPPVTVKRISLEPSSLELTAGEQGRLSYMLTPEDAPSEGLVWSSSDTDVASVADGVVEAKSAGEAQITLSAPDKTVFAQAAVTVKQTDPLPVAVQSISLEPSSLKLTAGEQGRLSYTLTPEDAPSEGLVWSSSNADIASVADGVVEAKSAGEVQITLSAPDKTVFGQAAVTVKKRDTPPVDPPPGPVTVPGGVYTGQTKNGKPHGMGTIRYNARTLIDSRDVKKRYAEAGQSITGQFEDGRLLQGKLYDSKGDQLDAIIIGGGAH